MTQVEHELMHYGVLGMKWGVRRTRRAVKTYTSKAEKQIAANTRNAKTLKTLLTNNYDPATERKLTSFDKKAYATQLDNANKATEQWVKAQKDILSMDIAKVDANSVKARFDEARKRSRVYYPFG